MTAPSVPGPAASTVGSDRRLARYVRRYVYPYSAYYRPVLDSAGVGARVGGVADLGRIPPTELGTVADPGALVLRPDVRTIVRAGHRPLAARTVAAKATGGMRRFNRRVLEHQFKPVHWVVADGVPIGYSQADLVRLARLGEQWLTRAGVGHRDVVLSVLHPGPSVAHWQLVMGCRRARTSAIHLDPTVSPEWAERVAPTVIAGEPQQLVGILARSRVAGHRLANLRTILAVGDPLAGSVRARLTELGDGAVVVGAWAPPGVRAVWTECRESVEASAPTGYHVWADDVLEVGGGELLWTGAGWMGSALLRLRTFTSVRIEQGQCGACGRSVARIVPLAPVDRPVVDAVVPVVEEPSAPMAVAGIEAVLDAEAEVAAWQVEYRTVGGADETIVVLAPAWGAAVVPLIRRLDRHIHATQFVVLPAEALAARVAASDGNRIIDTSGVRA